MKKFLTICLCIILISAFSGCSTAGKLYQDGKKSFINGNYEAAADYFAAAIKENSNRADYYIDYSMSLIKLGRYEEALEEFDKAYVNKDIIIANRNNKRIYRGKGIAYYSMAEYNKAIDEFNQALAIHVLSDLDMDILYYIGSAQMTNGSYEAAINTYNSIIAKDDKDALAYNNRALCYKNLGDYANSLTDYDRAISLKPDTYSFYFGKYYLLQESGDEAAANEVLNKASEITVKTSEDQYNLAKIHYCQGEYETALSELNDGFVNGFKEAYYYIGEIYRLKKDYQKAIYYYKIYLEEGEITTPNVYNQIAACLIKTGEYNDAIKYLEQGIAYHYADNMRILYRNEIIVYECLGKFDIAEKKLKEYMSRYPDDQEAEKEAEFITTRVMEATLPATSE